MPITLTCPSCGKQCAVKDEYAGMQVRCPSCPAVITAPPAAPPVARPVPAVVATQPFLDEPTAPFAPASTFAPPPPLPSAFEPPPYEPPPLRRVPSGPSFIDKTTKFLAANGVSGVNMILLLIGLGCMAFFIITIALPWIRIFDGSLHGIQIGMGIVDLLLILGLLFLFGFVVLMEWSRLFDYCLWTVSNLSIFIVLQLVTMLGRGAWGLYISLVVMLAAAGTLGVVAFSKVFGSKSAGA